MLEADKEYIALVSKYLTTEQLVWWVKLDASDWNTFYCFLEKQIKEACQIQVLQNTDLGCKPLAGKRECLLCSGDHGSNHCKLQSAISISNMGVCKVCGVEAHTYFNCKLNKAFPDHWVFSCPKYKSGSKVE